MTREQAGRIVAEIAASYPKQPFPPETVLVYTEYLSDLDYEACLRGVRRIVRSSVFAPTIAEIRREAALEQIGLPDPDRAWELVVARWGSSREHVNTEIDVPPEVRNALEVAGVDVYRYWTSEDPLWLRKAFMEVYGAAYRRILREEATGLPFAHEVAELGGVTEAGVVRELGE